MIANIGIYFAAALGTSLVTLPVGGYFFLAGAILYLPLFYVPFLAVVEVLGRWLEGLDLRFAVFGLVLIAWIINMATTEDPVVGVVLIPAAVAIATWLRLPEPNIDRT